MVNLSLRLFLVAEFGASVAMADEWEATGEKTLVAWQSGTLDFAALFSAHNGDHRIVATRLWEILWFTLNGAWDPQLVMSAKAVVYAVAAVSWVHLLAGNLRRRRFSTAAILTLLLAFPFGYQNILWAFQSQFDFFLLACALGWLAVTRNRPLAALAAAVAALFTLGAGPVLAASYLPYFFVARVRGLYSSRQTATLCVLAAGIVGFGLSLRSADASPPGPPAGQAKTFAKLAAWPASTLPAYVYRLPESAHLFPAEVLDFPSRERSWLRGVAGWLHRHPAAIVVIDGALMVVMLLPLALLLAAAWRDRFRETEMLGPLALATLALFLLAAMAIARSEQTTVSVRYLDLVALLGFCSGVACQILRTAPGRARFCAALWLMIFPPGYLATMGGTLLKLNHRMPQYWLANLQDYFPARDHSILTDNSDARWPILEKDPEKFMAFLDRADVQPVLPRSLTDPSRTRPGLARAAHALGQWAWLPALLAAGAAAWMVWAEDPSRRRFFQRRYYPRRRALAAA